MKLIKIIAVFIIGLVLFYFTEIAMKWIFVEHFRAGIYTGMIMTFYATSTWLIFRDKKNKRFND